MLAPEFDRAHQTFNPYALRQLPQGVAMVRFSSSEAELVEMHPNPLSCGSPERVKGRSRLHYGRRSDEVEERIQRLLAASCNRRVYFSIQDYAHFIVSGYFYEVCFKN